MSASKNSASSNIRKILLLLAAALFFLYIISEPIQKAVLSFLFPGQDAYVLTRITLFQMTLQHIGITALASCASILIGTLIGTLVTRKTGQALLPFTQTLNSIIQTLPPSAVLIIAFPFLGFGWGPTILALFLYSLFPIMSNTIVGFQQIPAAVLDAAEGMGLNPQQRLRFIEIPMAIRIILTGIRYAVILNIGTAAIGAIVGAGGLGTIIISGLTRQNSALIFSGAVSTAGLAILSDLFFAAWERRLPQTT